MIRSPPPTNVMMNQPNPNHHDLVIPSRGRTALDQEIPKPPVVDRRMTNISLHLIICFSFFTNFYHFFEVSLFFFGSNETPWPRLVSRQVFKSHNFLSFFFRTYWVI